MFTFKKTHPLQPYIDQFLLDRGERYQDNLDIFLHIFHGNMLEIRKEDVERYKMAVYNKYNSEYMKMQAMIHLNVFLRYWRGKGHKYLCRVK